VSSETSKENRIVVAGHASCPADRQLLSNLTLSVTPFPFERQEEYWRPHCRLRRRSPEYTIFPSIPACRELLVEPETVTYARVHESRQSSSTYAWVDASAASGLRQFRIQLIPVSLPESSRTYDIQVRFAAPAGITSGESKCMVLVQGTVVIRDLDIIAEGGGRSTLVREVKAVRVDRELVLELRPSREARGVPELCGIRIQVSPETRRQD